jgi:hypothetical protein
VRARFVIGMAACLIAKTVYGASGGQFEGEVIASWINGGTDRDMKLTQSFTFIDCAGKRWTAPADAVINGASIPQPLWTWARSVHRSVSSSFGGARLLLHSALHRTR